MRRSVLTRRIILLMLSAVVLSGGISAGIYIFVTQRMYASTRAEELMPMARSIAGMMAGIREPRPGLERNNRDFLGALMHIYDAEGNPGNPVPDQGRGFNPPVGEPEPDPSATAASAILYRVLAGKEVSEVRTADDGQSYLVVGAPILNGEQVMGAVIFTKPMTELAEATRGMNLTLLVSTLIAFLIMLIPGYLMARRLVVPIRRMEDVARSMAAGDFSVRADETQKGEIGELGRAMNHFAAESERLEQTRRDYVANVSHELRTPIASILAMGETLRDGMAKSGEKQALFYNNIVRESTRLSRLVDDLLELSRIQSSADAKICFDLREPIRNAADIYSYMAVEAGLEFVFNADMDRAMPVFSSPDRVEQVLVILLDNAIKHASCSLMQPGLARIVLLAEDKGGYFEISVANTGDAIPADDIPYIFERFYKVDKSHSGGGTGIGLSIAREITKGLGEKVAVAENGQGMVRFVFTVHKNAVESKPPHSVSNAAFFRTWLRA